MKIADLLEYRVHKKIGNKYISDAISQGDLYKDELTFINTKDESVEVGFMKPNANWLSLYIFLDGKCEGALELDILQSFIGYVRHLKKEFGNRPFCTPHIALSPKLKGLGYAKMLYSIALDKGCVFVTQGHTKEAKKLWDSLSSSYDTRYYVGQDVFSDDDEFAQLRIIGKDL